MKCPKCGNEMAAGFLQCSQESTIAWVSKLLPLGMGYWKADSEIVSTALGTGTPAIPAHICKSCKLLVGDYSEKE